MRSLSLRGRVLLAAVVSIAAGLLVVLALPDPAGAYKLNTQRARWIDPQLTYYVRSGSKLVTPAKKAAAAWNTADAGVTFMRTRKKSQADITATTQSTGGCTGGFTNARFVQTINGRDPFSGAETDLKWIIDDADITIAKACGKGLRTLVLIHELGHAIGLDHETKRCARMNPAADGVTGTPDQCELRSLKDWLERPLRKDDIRGARKLYR